MKRIMLLAVIALFATTAMGQQLFLENFTDGTLDDARVSISALDPATGFFAPHAGRGVSTAWGNFSPPNLFTYQGENRTDFILNTPYTVDFSDSLTVYFVKHIIFADASATNTFAGNIFINHHWADGDLNGATDGTVDSLTQYRQWGMASGASMGLFNGGGVTNITAVDGVAAWDAAALDGISTNWAVFRQNPATGLLQGEGSGAWNGVGGSTYIDADMSGYGDPLANQKTITGINYDGYINNDNMQAFSNLSNNGALGLQQGIIEVEMGVTIAADFNLDYVVDVSDLGILAGNWQTVGGAILRTGDASNDGNVDVSDLGILSGAWGSTITAVPEPATLSLLALGGLAVLRRRK